MASRASNQKKRKKGKKAGRRRQFSEEEKKSALSLYVAGMKRPDVAEAIGCSGESIRIWYKKAKASGTLPKAPVNKSNNVRSTKQASRETKEPAGASESPRQSKSRTEVAMVPAPSSRSSSIYTPHDPGQGLAQYEQEAILEYKKLYPSMQPAQLKKQLKRFKGWRISIKAIAKVLRANGYEMVHRGSRPEGPEPLRFEAPRRGALWQADFGEFRVAGERLHLLVVLDDFSRFAVGHRLADSPEAEVVISTLTEAIARHGKPEALRTDRGGAFLSGELGRYLETELIDHIVGRSYHPEGGGKVESLVGTVRRELWDVEHFESRRVAEDRLKSFFDSYNERRAHMGIDGLTPADRFFGRGDRVLDAINAISRRRQGSLALLEGSDGPIEELTSPRSKAPLEVLRLVLVDRTMELRFCGARVRLGMIEI